MHHPPGANNLADSLSRWSDLQHPSDECIDSPQINAIEHALEINSDVAKAIATGYQFDKELAPIIDRLEGSQNDNLHKRYHMNKESRHLYLRDTPNFRLCMPNGPLRLKLLQEHHECVTAGHPGRDHTYGQLARFFYWPKMGCNTKKFVK